ncbi:MAG TPA: undecaprenyl-phosphate galactose phosphotransferase WbaP [Acetobacteraceae bacterium]|jgi:undecaprenyl-phosphate galactose phosphotransferase|nr:undecaprenyl-phosphate galactose phosphotransferase WbaP [Acetobacteraceae bacterium]
MYPLRRVEHPEFLSSGVRLQMMSATQTRSRSVVAERICQLLLVGSDALAFVPAVFLAFAVHVATQDSPLARALENLSMLGTAWHGWGSLLVLVSLLGYFGGRGHYTSRVPFWTQLGDVVMGTAIALACDAFLTIAVYDRPVQLEGLLRWVFYCPFLLLFRTGVRELLRVCGVWSINTLIIAGRGVAEQARAALVSDPVLGYELVGSLELADVATLGDQELLDLLNDHCADFVVVAVGSGQQAAERSVIAALRRAKRPIALVPAMEGLPVVGLRQHHFFSHDFVMLVSRNNLARPFSRAVKAAFDQVVAAAFVLLFAPLLLVLAAVVRSDGGPAFYRHRRIGASGRSFGCIKFRTMVTDADRVLDQVLATDPAAAAEWAATQKLNDDPRITRFGRFLRRSSLDELPQLFNVLRGEMSLVGPRPIVQAEVGRYAEDIEYYYETKPGLTGLWQVSGRSDTSYERRVRLDVWYVRNWTLWHDIAILLKTIPAVFLQRGAQ